MKKTTLFLFFVCCILVACTCKKKTSSPSILGLWVVSEYRNLDRQGNVDWVIHCNDMFANYYCFHANNTITTKNGKKYGSWEIRNDTLIVKRDSMDVKIYKMKIDYNTLLLRDVKIYKMKIDNRTLLPSCDTTGSADYQNWVTQEMRLMRISKYDIIKPLN